MGSEFAIHTENLTKHYRKSFWKKALEPALDKLSISVPHGSVFGFLGPNGAGKTTTIRCLMDLIRPTGGSAWVLGEPCSNIDVRGKIGYLPDSPAFGTHLSARQFLKTCAKLLRLTDRDAKLKIDEVLGIVRMSKHKNEQLSGFSRGMLQRIGIAQALLNDPELLILDEPLVGLDPVGRKELLDIVRSRKEAGVSVFFCSHILSDVESLCDRVGILNEGRLMVTGTMDDLLTANGCSLSIPAASEEFAKGAMMQADNSHREADGGWVLEFFDDKKFEAIAEKGLPDNVRKVVRKEGLEDLFFRMTDAHPTQKEPATDASVDAEPAEKTEVSE
jgi:ABC-2 type transport system ATP-binding protein